MLFDQQLLFSDAQDVSQVAGTYASTNVLDLGGANPRQIGSGEIVKVYFNMTEALVGATATMNVQLVSSAATALTTPTVHAQTGALAVGTWVLGYSGILAVPRSGIVLRYLGLLYVIAVATTTAGLITAGIVSDDDSKVKAAWTGVAAVTNGAVETA